MRLSPVPAGGGRLFHPANDAHALRHLPKDDVLAIKVRCFDRRDEKLATVRVLARVGHREQPGRRVLLVEVLVFELLTVNRLAPCAVAVGEVPALAHELGDDAVERRALVVQRHILGRRLPLLARTQRAEVLTRARRHVIPQLKDDPPLVLPADRDVEEDALHHFAFHVHEES